MQVVAMVERMMHLPRHDFTAAIITITGGRLANEKTRLVSAREDPAYCWVEE
jgi:hypothetical protein